LSFDNFDTLICDICARQMTDAEAESLFLAIDQGEVQQFGISRLASLELNDLHRAPWCFGGSSLCTTLLDFAAWRGRDSFVCALMTAGADPSQGEVDMSVWEKLPRAYAAWLARAAVRLRKHVPEDATCVCGKKALAFFSPCSHVCCASCPWRQFQNFNFGRLPELICPRCNLTFEDHTMEFLAQRRGIIRCDRAPPWISQSNCQSCHSCGCVNAAQATQCINCGWTPSEPRVGWKVGWKSWKFSCFDWLRPSRPGHLATRFAPLRPSWDPWLRQRKVQSLERWKELPEDLEEPRFRDVGG